MCLPTLPKSFTSLLVLPISLPSSWLQYRICVDHQMIHTNVGTWFQTCHRWLSVEKTLTYLLACHREMYVKDMLVPETSKNLSSICPIKSIMKEIIFQVLDVFHSTHRCSGMIHLLLEVFPTSSWFLQFHMIHNVIKKVVVKIASLVYLFTCITCYSFRSFRIAALLDSIAL